MVGSASSYSQWSAMQAAEVQAAAVLRVGYSATESGRNSFNSLDVSSVAEAIFGMLEIWIFSLVRQTLVSRIFFCATWTGANLLLKISLSQGNLEFM